MTAEQIQKVIKKLCVDSMGKNAVRTADWDLDKIAQAVCEYSVKYNIEARLALAQGILECHFALAPGANRSRKTRNIYNVGNVDDGGNRYFTDYRSGIEAYCRLLAREYNWGYYEATGITSLMSQQIGGELSKRYPVTTEGLIARDFRRPKGGRYATDPDYSTKIAMLVNKIDKAVRAK
jgi:flagellum-specific peptidoglycan hydrolase FlgJ